jgi:CheY-like chemotaxis protein
MCREAERKIVAVNNHTDAAFLPVSNGPFALGHGVITRSNMSAVAQTVPLHLRNMAETKVVLVADDSDNDFLLLKGAFLRAGLKHQLVHVQDGRQAVSYLKGEVPFDERGLWPFPDLLILDAIMPEVRGAEVVKFLRQEREIRVPAVLLSGSIAPWDANQALELGAAEYIVKSGGFDELVTMAQTIHFRWLS